MTLKGIHKICSFAMALLVLMSTLSFTMEKHFCGDTLVDVAIFSEVNTCGMELNSISSSTEKKSCCSDEIEIIKGQDQLKKTSFEDLQLLPLFFERYGDDFCSDPIAYVSQQNNPHKDYSPPILVADIQVLDQVFII